MRLKEADGQLGQLNERAEENRVLSSRVQVLEGENAQLELSIQVMTNKRLVGHRGTRSTGNKCKLILTKPLNKPTPGYKLIFLIPVCTLQAAQAS